MVIKGKVEIEDMTIWLGGRDIQASFCATCKGSYTKEDAEMYDSNGTGYPGWEGVNLESVSVDEWIFFDNDGNEIELTEKEKDIAEKQMIEAVNDDESSVEWEYQ